MSKSEFSLRTDCLKTKCLKSDIKDLCSGDHYLIKGIVFLKAKKDKLHNWTIGKIIQRPKDLLVG